MDILLRKDYKTEVVPATESVGLYLAQNAIVEWVESFVDEDTAETVNINRTDVVVPRGRMITPRMVEMMTERGVKQVTVANVAFRAQEWTLFSHLANVKVTVRNNLGDTAVLIVRSDSLRGAQDLAADYAEGAVNCIFKTQCADHVYITKSEIIEGIHFIGRTKADIKEEEENLEKDPESSVKEPFKVKASFIDAEVYMPEDTKSKMGVHNKDTFVVWAYDVVTAKNIVFDYLKNKFLTVLKGRETLRVIGATQFYAHTYVSAEYCNEYIEQENLKLPVEE